jgi:UDP-N-acetylmuramyl tripeptide synthase
MNRSWLPSPTRVYRGSCTKCAVGQVDVTLLADRLNLTGDNRPLPVCRPCIRGQMTCDANNIRVPRSWQLLIKHVQGTNGKTYFIPLILVLLEIVCLFICGMHKQVGKHWILSQ